MASGRSVRRLFYVLVPIAAVVVLVLVFRWDWFVPLVQARASAALGRPVQLAHLHVSLGRVTQIVADDVQISNPDGFPANEPLAQVAHVGVSFDVENYIRHRTIVIPSVDLDQPKIAAIATEDGSNNYTFHFPAPASRDGQPLPDATDPAIGNLTIEGGQVHVLIPKLRTDATADISTQVAQQPVGADASLPPTGANAPPQPVQIVIDAKGTYAGQPVTGKLIGGALLSLRDTQHPYPIDLHLANGPTQISLVGTVQNPLVFAGADLKLNLTGPDMAQLYALTGIPLPKTPPYKVNGQLDYADGKIRFRDFAGQVGHSDIGGTVVVDPGKERQDVTADLHSRSVDLEDLGGFIGSEPGRTNDPGMTAEQRQAVANAEASSQLLPTKPINLPKLRSADIHLKYRGDKIAGRNVPFDTINVTLDIIDGNINIHPMTLGVGTGQILANMTLSPMANNEVHANGEVQVQRLDVGRMLAATHAINGAGRLGGSASIDSTGTSMASLLGNGNGKLDLYMSGGNINALLVDLSGLEFGNALLSALGIPARAELQCLIGQFALQRGVLQTHTLLIDTSEAVINGTGTVDLGHERLALEIRTEAKHFSIGSLPAPVGITGTFKKPSIGPDLLTLGARGAAAAGLGVLFPPLALLPTIQLGVGDDNRCAGLVGRKK